MTRGRKVFLLVGLLLIACSGFGVLLFSQKMANASSPAQSTAPGDKAQQIVGTVRTADGPIAGATVRIQATENKTFSAEDGTFTLGDLNAGQPVTVTASAKGHYIGWAAAVAGGPPITITLNAHYVTDNYEYEWFEENGVEGSAACGACHTSYNEWLADGHSQSATNPRFLTMYAGTDVEGNTSPPPDKNNIGVPLPPDLSKPYYGPGFKLDFPNNAGNCATCHTPMAAKMPNAQNCGWSGCHKDSTATLSNGLVDPGVSPLGLEGDAAEGISCEFCHKIGNVYINKKTGLPYPDMPGILSLKLHRPTEGNDLIFGSVDDIARTDVPEPRDAYLPLQKESAYCAGCHYGILGGVVVGNMATKGGVLIYSSFSEWLESPYSDAETGKSCQDCHMRAGDYEYFAWPAQGGVTRDPQQVHNHRMLSEELLQNAATLTATAVLRDDRVLVRVELLNDQTGHHLPTDSPLRHAILVVEAKDAEGNPLALQLGPKLPEWTGNYAGQPGQAYAKILQDEWSGETPTGAIWRPIRIVEDTRLAALENDVSRYVFRAPTDGPITVDVRLVYRKAFQQLMEWKGWDDPDIVMEEATLQIEGR